MKLFTPRYDDPNSLASRLRRRRAERLRPMIVAISVGNWTCSILDIGGEASYWQTAIGLDDLRELRAPRHAAIAADSCATLLTCVAHRAWPPASVRDRVGGPALPGEPVYWGTLSADTITWQVNGANTFVCVNTSSAGRNSKT
jgi:hypothetical protein